MKEQFSRFIQLLSLGFFSLHSKLFSYILIPPHLGCAFILFFAVFAEFTVKTWDICRTYAGDILEWSHVYSSKRDQRAESWSGLSPSGPHLSWAAESHRGCECWLSWSPTNWDLSTLTRGCLLPCSIFCSARSISQIPHCRPHLAICSQCCPCDDDYSYTNPWSSMLWLSYSYSFRGFLQSVIYNSSSVLPHSGSILQLCFHS